MNNICCVFRFALMGCVWSTLAPNGHAELITYVDENSYLAGLAARGYVSVQEGFEDDGAWGSVRSTTATSITNLGITWKSNNTVSKITTGSGPALTGDWGFYTLPHGDFSNNDPAVDIPDGFTGTSM